MRHRSHDSNVSSSSGSTTTTTLASPAGEIDDDRSGEFLHLSPGRRPSPLWILPQYFIYALVMGMIIVPKLTMILALICRRRLSEQAAGLLSSPLPSTDDPLTPGDECRTPEVQAEVTHFTLVLSLLISILSAIMTPRLTALSSKWGRTRVIGLCAIGTSLTDLATLLVSVAPSVPVEVVWLGGLAEGLCGSLNVGMALGHSYIADCVPEHQRGTLFAFLHGAICLGIGLGPVVGSAIASRFGVPAVFVVGSIFHVLFGLMVGLVVPESLSVSQRTAAVAAAAVQERSRKAAEIEEESIRAAAGPVPFLQRRVRGLARGWESLVAPLRILVVPGPAKASLLLLVAMDTLWIGLSMGILPILVLYTNYAFGWGNTGTARYISLLNWIRVAVLFLGMPVLNRWLSRFDVGRIRLPLLSSSPSGSNAESADPLPSPKLLPSPSSSSPSPSPAPEPAPQATGMFRSDILSIRFAFMLSCTGFAGYSFSRSPTLFVISGCVTALAAGSDPTLQAALTKHVSKSEVADLLGATGLLHALSRVVAPMLVGLFYSATVGWSGGRAIWFLMTTCILALIVATFGLQTGTNVRVNDDAGVDDTGEGEVALITGAV